MTGKPPLEIDVTAIDVGTQLVLKYGSGREACRYTVEKLVWNPSGEYTGKFIIVAGDLRQLPP